MAEFDPYGNTVERAYAGGLESGFSVLQSPTYWTGGCKDNWQRPDDLVFEFTLKGKGGSFTSHNIVFTWENEVVVQEVFFLLAEGSSTGQYLRFEM